MDKTNLPIYFTLLFFTLIISVNFTGIQKDVTDISKSNSIGENELDIVQIPETICLFDQETILEATFTPAPEVTGTLILNFQWTRNGELVRNVFLSQDQFIDQLVNLGSEDQPIDAGEYTLTVQNDFYEPEIMEQQTLILEGDVSSPVIHCFETIVVSNDTGECGALVSFEMPSAEDSCEVVVTQIEGLESGSFFPIGESQLTFIAIDNSGNETSCSTQIIVQDNQVPQAVCQDVTIALDENGESQLTVNMLDNGSTDACGITVMTISQTDFNCDDIGVNTVVLTLVDESGNSSNCEATVTVIDNILPQIECPSAMSIEIEGNSFELPDFTTDEFIIASDNCEIITIEQDPTPGSFVPLGVQNVVITATDEAGNSLSCIFEVTVEDLLSVQDKEADLTTLSVFYDLGRTPILNNPRRLFLDKMFIYDSKGFRVTQIDINNNNNSQKFIEVTSLKTGIYFAQIFGENAVIVLRIVVF